MILKIKINPMLPLSIGKGCIVIACAGGATRGALVSLIYIRTRLRLLAVELLSTPGPLCPTPLSVSLKRSYSHPVFDDVTLGFQEQAYVFLLA